MLEKFPYKCQISFSSHLQAYPRAFKNSLTFIVLIMALKLSLSQSRSISHPSPKKKVHFSPIPRVHSSTFDVDIRDQGSQQGSNEFFGFPETFEYLPIISHSTLSKKLSDTDNNPIIFDGNLIISQPQQHTYFRGGILTKKYLYLTSTINYEIWEEFRDRSKIDHLDQHKEITKDIALKLLKNIHIMDQKYVTTEIQKAMLGVFKNKTPFDVKMRILLAKKDLRSLATFLGLRKFERESMHIRDKSYVDESYQLMLIDEDDPGFVEEKHENVINDIKYIIIKNFFDFYILPEEKRETFCDYILDDIPWMNSMDVGQTSIVIELIHYNSYEIIDKCHQRKLSFFSENNLNQRSVHRIKIEPYYGFRKRQEVRSIKQMKIKDFNILRVLPVEIETYYPFAFTLQKGNDEYEGSITFVFKSRNVCHEWVTYLEHAIGEDNRSSQTTWNLMKEVMKKKEIATEQFMKLEEFLQHEEFDSDAIFGDIKGSIMATSNIGNKINAQCFHVLQRFVEETENRFVNDFGYIKSDGNVFDFSFGEYLNYWIFDEADDTVKPRYDTLKQELLENNIATLSSAMYNRNYDKASRLLCKIRHKIKAQYIGINNKEFNIPPGAPITINHIISLIVYTDFTYIQKQFKIHCRKYRPDEDVKQLVIRNQEIAHWCRYLKECCTFYGKEMRDEVFYTGLNKKLMFSSMKQHFECPLSTSAYLPKAHEFTDEEGIIIAVKAANPKTRYFDVSWLSCHPMEQERLFMGSSLKIVEIYVDNVRSLYIPAIQMLEEMLHGHYISDSQQEQRLYHLIQWILQMTSEAPSEYVQALFKKMLSNIDGTDVWINQKDIAKLKKEALRNLFSEQTMDLFLKQIGINASAIHYVQEFVWDIKGDEYVKFVKMGSRKSMKSESYEYILNDTTIFFHLESCYKCSDQSPKCGIFLYLDQLPPQIESVCVEYDLVCEYKLTKREKKSIDFDGDKVKCLILPFHE